jgi:hypothetical protein
VLTLLCTHVATHAQAFTNDCRLKFQGSYRKVIKNRVAANGVDYTLHNNGEPILVKDRFALVCSFDPKIESRKITTITAALKGFEMIKVPLEVFSWERSLSATSRGDGKDNDFHLEISDSKQWRSKHVIVEVPSGPEFCDAQKRILDIVNRDECGGDMYGSRLLTDNNP